MTTTATTYNTIPIVSGDKVFVRLSRMHSGAPAIAELTLNNISCLNEIYDELRKVIRGLRGLAMLYIRNVTKGRSMQQPFMLYMDSSRKLCG